MNTATVSLAVTPTVVSTLVSHYLNRKPRRQKPTAHISYDEGLHLIRSFLTHASRHTVEELQAFTSQWVPHPQWVKVDEVQIPDDQLSRAADLLAEQLGSDGIRRVGGKEWWQWRKAKVPLKAEWIEMKSDYHERKKNADTGNRVMLYVHGGAYFFGSVDEHRYQIQRHARKLRARALAPRYRLAPQFPFPCGLQDCLATYLYLLTQQDPSTIVIAGDSAGGGMVLSLLVILRDRGISLPAGAVLISPWVDLTHSFPSVSDDCPFDYIPPSGFHHKPSMAWPPPDEGELDELKKQAISQKKELAKEAPEPNPEAPTTKQIADATTRLALVIDGENVEIKEQLQIYTTNDLIAHPLVSPVMQPTLGGLPPLLIMVGGGEMLRDEQIYLAHKCANPEKYLPAESLLDDNARAQIQNYPPTDVQLQVWDNLCHVAPTLSFTTPAKHMYRSVAQFSAWCLARAQKTNITILDDDQISVISQSSDISDQGAPAEKHVTVSGKQEGTAKDRGKEQSIGMAGDALPPFKNHMIRQRVTTNGTFFPLPPPEDLPACRVERDHVGLIKVGPVRKWLAHKQQWESRYRKSRQRVRQQRLADMAAGYQVFAEGEVPPPTALAGRRKMGGDELEIKKKVKGLGLALWGLWGSKHDQMTMRREHEADTAPLVRAATAADGGGARTFSDIQRQEKAAPPKKFARLVALKPPHWRRVTDENQAPAAQGSGGKDKDAAPAMPSGHISAAAVADDKKSDDDRDAEIFSPGEAMGDIGVTGKRVFIEGLATPFSLRKEADTASMITLQPSRPPTPGPNRLSALMAEGEGVWDGDLGGGEKDDLGPATATSGFVTPFLTPGLMTPGGRPGLEKFVTAEEVPRATSPVGPGQS
ncbi:hypothetical protein B0T18DRAFT_430595 [Schizothecium vesticola]|uniref:Alpha/beta hydrolase fold-3 domain-containing protein n=1 Tax=Schizothecium vesticola TaxID=314040 RepID=A0AA40EPT5_9PEZI|nr:hypothetical protein B0T18DRAFT_430595 [Schizothecium vesticola]